VNCFCPSTLDLHFTFFHISLEAHKPTQGLLNMFLSLNFYALLLSSSLFQLSCALPLLDSILDPYDQLLKSILEGDGLVDGTIGTLQGALGIEATFDYVIAGGGTAGNAIGVRLAEAGHKVAIIEAGNFYQIGKPVLGATPQGDIIGVGASIIDNDPLVDWSFMTEPQGGLNGRKIHYARGKCLGGSYVSPVRRMKMDGF
jgi:hypothetical protein